MLWEGPPAPALPREASSQVCGVSKTDALVTRMDRHQRGEAAHAPPAVALPGICEAWLRVAPGL